MWLCDVEGDGVHAHLRVNLHPLSASARFAVVFVDGEKSARRNREIGATPERGMKSPGAIG